MRITKKKLLITSFFILIISVIGYSFLIKPKSSSDITSKVDNVSSNIVVFPDKQLDKFWIVTKLL